MILEIENALEKLIQFEYPRAKIIEILQRDQKQHIKFVNLTKLKEKLNTLSIIDQNYLKNLLQNLVKN